MARWMIASVLQRLSTLPPSDPLYQAGLARVRALRAEHQTPADLARALGCSERNAQRALRAFGVEGYRERCSPIVRRRPAPKPRPVPESHAHPAQPWCSCANCLRARGRAA